MKHKKAIWITLAVVAAVLLAGIGLWFFWLKDYLAASSASPVYVQSVLSINGGSAGVAPRFSGIVEPQKTIKVNKDDTKTLAQVYVTVGQEVKQGTPLFQYNTEEMQLQLTQLELELEGINNRITTLKTQKSTLEKEKAKASDDDQYSYTVQIQSVELDIKNEEYNASVKKNEIDKLKHSLDNADVLSETEGVIKEINITPKTDSTGQPAPFISILSTGEYRVKGTVTELNIQSLSTGMPVTVHSRIDPDQTWAGTLESIDYENKVQDNNPMMYSMDGSSANQSSKYNFYVTLSHLDGLILGQHVYIETGETQSAQKSGLFLPAFYLVRDDSGSYVWVKNEAGKLEKRKVLLGDYDTENDQYEITEGLSLLDCIAMPTDALLPGMPTTQDNTGQVPGNTMTDAGDPGLATGGGAAIPEAGGGAVALPEGEGEAAMPEASSPDAFLSDDAQAMGGAVS